MSNRKVERLGLDEKNVVALKSININTVKDFLEESPLRLQILLDMNSSDIKMFIDSICEKVSPKLKTASALLQEHKQKLCFLSTRMPTIDQHLKGGIPFASITEVCGPPGIGKTQFCLNASLQAILMDSTIPHGVLYIDTELKFDVARIVEMFNYDKQKQHYNIEENELLNRIKIVRPLSCKELLDAVEGSLQNIIIEMNVKLIVLDSIAALPRKENLNEVDKEQYIVRLASQLKEIADECSCCVLITNQISGTPTGSSSESSRDDGLCDHIPSGIRLDTNHSNSSSAPTNLHSSDLNRIMSSSYYKASLGSIWYHCISTRMVLYLEERYRDDTPKAQSSKACTTSENDITTSVRVLALVKSPICSHFQQAYAIASNGLVETYL